MKIIFVIPGFKQKTTSKSFVWLKKFLSEKGFDVVIVPVTWEYKTMSDYVAEFESFYIKNKYFKKKMFQKNVIKFLFLIELSLTPFIFSSNYI